MRSYHFIFFLGLVLSLGSCVSEFRPEAIDPRLPDYSEEGLNTAGAYIDGFPWVARRHLSYFFIFPSGISGSGDIYLYRSPDTAYTQENILAFEYGQQNRGDWKRPMSIGFYLSSGNIKNPTDLKALDGKTIDLDGNENYGQLFTRPTSRTAESGPDSLFKGIGALHIRHVHLIENTDSVIISGTFGFDVVIDSVKHTVHSGRFDYALSSNEIQNFRRR